MDSRPTQELSAEIIAVISELGSDAVYRYNESMTVREAAQFLKINKNQVLRYTRCGLPYYKMGNRFCFLMKDLVEFREKFRSSFEDEIRIKKSRVR